MNLFVYGTLRPSLYPHRHPGTPVRDAVLPGKFRMFNLGRFPALVYSAVPTNIHGEVFDVQSSTMYDAYEGYAPGGKGLYDKVEVPVIVEGREELAWVYFMHDKRLIEFLDRTPVPGGDWSTELVRRK